MTAPIPNPVPPETDWKFFFEWVFGWVSSSSIIIYLIRQYFRDKAAVRMALAVEAERAEVAKKTQTEEFIQKVSIACVKSVFNEYRGVVDSSINDLKAKVEVLFKYREDDRAHYDQKFDNLMREVKK